MFTAVLRTELELAERRADAHFATVVLRGSLRSRSQVRRQKALKAIITRPDCQDFIGDVKKLCQKTRCLVTWKLAKRTLFTLSPRDAVEMDKKHPFSEINQWKATHVR